MGHYPLMKCSRKQKENCRSELLGPAVASLRDGALAAKSTSNACSGRCMRPTERSAAICVNALMVAFSSIITPRVRPLRHRKFKFEVFVLKLNCMWPFASDTQAPEHPAKAAVLNNRFQPSVKPFIDIDAQNTVAKIHTS